MSYELHPEIPRPGVSLAQLFSGMSSQDTKNMQEQLNMMGAPYGISFKEMSWAANTNLALQASEYARDHGKFHEYHDQLLYANFTEGKNIGELDVLLDIGKEIGLDSKELKAALQENHYQTRLLEAKKAAEKGQVTATPTFIINDHYKIVGAQTFRSFQKIFQEIVSENLSNPFKIL
jgi:predicted DsbA family dithiol-disulfide isomerase